MEDECSTQQHPYSLWTSLVCGGIAGFSVDVSLYPIDTIKTRLQAPEGFAKAGGFRGVYRGLSVAAWGWPRTEPNVDSVL